MSIMGGLCWVLGRCIGCGFDCAMVVHQECLVVTISYKLESRIVPDAEVLVAGYD